MSGTEEELIAALTSATSEHGVPLQVDKWRPSVRNAAMAKLRVRGWKFAALHDDGHAYLRVVVVGS